MRSFEQRRAEIFSRAERIKKRERAARRRLALAAPVMACAVFAAFALFSGGSRPIILPGALLRPEVFRTETHHPAAIGELTLPDGRSLTVYDPDVIARVTEEIESAFSDRTKTRTESQQDSSGEYRLTVRVSGGEEKSFILTKTGILNTKSGERADISPDQFAAILEALGCKP